MAQPSFIKTTGAPLSPRRPDFFDIVHDGGLGVLRSALSRDRRLAAYIQSVTIRKETVDGYDLDFMLGWLGIEHKSAWRERLFGRRDLIVYIDGDHLRPVPFSCFSFRQLLDRLG